jgi:hypothetical protein
VLPGAALGAVGAAPGTGPGAGIAGAAGAGGGRRGAIAAGVEGVADLRLGVVVVAGFLQEQVRHSTAESVGWGL